MFYGRSIAVRLDDQKSKMKYLSPALLATILMMVGGCSMEGTKREWSELQLIESDNRSTMISKPEISERMGKSYLCVPSLSTGQRTWILLNAKYPPYYKQIPSYSNFQITSQDLDLIKSSGVASETVLQCLESHLTSDTR